VTGKRFGRKDQYKSPVSIGYRLDELTDYRVGSSNKRLSCEAYARIVKHPHIEVFVGGDHIQSIHSYFYTYSVATMPKIRRAAGLRQEKA
jgi:hypothetical protein